jgi:dinuclear metal center YbgI/SA1388 family protein
MVTRDELSRFLADLYQYQNVQDYCENGLQVEGKQEIEKIAFGVSFNSPLLERALAEKADAVIVHHGIFQQGLFKLRGILKNKIKLLLENDISLFGIHLPMDGHPQWGHNALLLKAIGIEEPRPFEFGFYGANRRNLSLEKILEIFHRQLHPENFTGGDCENESSIFSLSKRYGFTVLANGPRVPERIAVIAGESTGYYEAALEKGVDTFFAGGIKEHIPAISLETKSNFINLGHYYSEKPGVLALKKLIEKNFAVETVYIEVGNAV